MPLEPGKTIAHYRIDQKIGEGGMGIVYLATDTRLGRRIALKVLSAEMSAHADRRARFEREARAIAALNHPNIVTLHSVEEADGLTFLTMELVDGRPLTQLLARDGLELPKLLDWGLGIIDAMVAAHRQGVVHRDLKPDNIMVTADGRIKVLDFGLAKLREATALEKRDTALPTTSITEEGKILGTVSYMSPEQAEGKPIDHRSDIFSFGVVLYEMATGRRPFQGDTAISTISSILKDTPPPPHQINTALPQQIGRIVRRCLAKEPERRYNSTDDLLNELREVKDEIASGELTLDSGAMARTPAGARGAPRTPKRLALIGIGAAVAAIAVIAGWLWMRGEPAPATVPAMQGSIHMSRATTDGKVQEAAISPDGRYIAYVRREGTAYSLRLRQLATGDEVQVVAPSETSLFSSSFSADGDFLHYVAAEPGRGSGVAYRVSVLGGTPRRIVDGVVGVSPSPDGSRLSLLVGTPEESHLRISGPDGEDPRDVAQRKGRDHFDSVAEWSTDGRSLAIVSHRFGEPQQIVLIDAATGAEKPLVVASLKSFADLVWLPGREALLVAGSEREVNQQGILQIWEVPVSGPVQPLTRDLNSYQDVSVTSDGSTLAAVQVERQSGIDVAMVRDGVPGEFTELFPIAESRAGFSGVSWLTPDQLTHSMMQGDLRQIFVTDVTSRSSRTVTNGPEHHFPVVSRDGRTMVVSRSEGDRRNLWRVDPATGQGRRLTEGEFDNYQVVSADGAWVVYTAVLETIKLLKVPSTGGTPVELSPRPAWCTDVSSDGRILCFEADTSGDPKAVLIPLVGGESVPTAVPGAARAAKFGPDGRTITYLVSREGNDEIWSIPAQGGEPRLVVRFEGKDIDDFAWSPDGRRLAVVKASRSGDVVLLKRTGA